MLYLTTDLYSKLDKYTNNKIRPYLGTPKVGEDNSYHYTYCTICLINYSFYIGVSKRHYNSKYLGSGKYLKNSISKYGKKNFYRFIISFFPNRKDALDNESSLITEEMIKSEECFNITLGGGNPPIHSGATHHVHKKISNKTHHWIKGNYLPEEQTIIKLTKLGLNPWQGESHWIHKAILEGKAPNQGLKAWRSRKWSPKSRLTWTIAQTCYEIYKKDNKNRTYKIK